MNSDEQVMVNLNSAGIDELTQLPGIGPDIARRIINGRPYESIDELTRISGIGPVLFEQIKPSLTLETLSGEFDPGSEEGTPETGDIESPEETEMPDIEEPVETASDIDAEDESGLGDDAQPEGIEDVIVPEETDSFEPETLTAPEGKPEQPPGPVSPPSGITRSAAIGWAVFSGLLAMLLSIILSLGIIASINGGSLKFVTQSEFHRQQVILAELEKQSEQQTVELDGIHERLANLEALNGRINTLEKSVGAVQGEMDVAHKQLEKFSGEVEVLKKQIVGLAADIETFQAKISRAETFFENMRNLLNNLFPEE